MNLRLADVTQENFWDVINLKSEEAQVNRYQLFETYVGSNAFFIAYATVRQLKNRAIYDAEQLIGFATHGWDELHQRYELVSMMLGYQHQGKGYGIPSLELVIAEMVELYQCHEIYLSVIAENSRARYTYEKLGFQNTGEIFQAFHPELVYKLTLSTNHAPKGE